MSDPRARTLVRLITLLASVQMSAACSSDPQLAVSVVSPSPDPKLHARDVARVYALARRHDEAAILALGAPVATPTPVPTAAPTEVPVVLDASPGASAGATASASPSPTATPAPAQSPSALVPAVALALFTLDRKRYADGFAAAYPTDRDAVMNDYGVAFARAGIEPDGESFPISALGALALAGNAVAYTKLLEAAIVATPPLASLYQTQLRHVAAAVSPAATYAVLASISPAARLGAVAAVGWCHGPTGPLLAYRPPTPSPTPTGAPSAAGTAAGALPTFTPAPASSSAPAADPQAAEFAARVGLLQGAIANSSRVDCMVAQIDARKGLHRAARHAPAKGPPGKGGALLHVRVGPAPESQH